MRTISNPTIEPADKSFVIEFVLFGTATKPATRQKVTVIAVTARGAKRIAKAQWPRSSNHKVVAEQIRIQ